MGRMGRPETSVPSYQPTQSNIPKELRLRPRLKSRNYLMWLLASIIGSSPFSLYLVSMSGRQSSHWLPFYVLSSRILGSLGSLFSIAVARTSERGWFLNTATDEMEAPK